MSPPSIPLRSRYLSLLSRVDPWLVCAGLLALLPALVIARPGMPETADGHVHLLRAFEAARLLAQGVFYPRWTPDFYLGFGYPFFIFYAPGLHILAALLNQAGIGLVQALTAIQVLALILYSTGAYLAARDLLPGPGPGPAALLSAALYLYAPFRLRELFWQGNQSQFLAMALIPWCLWLLLKVARGGSKASIAGSALLLAMLVYAHHPTAFLVYPLLGLYTIILAFVETSRRGGRQFVSRVVSLAAAFLIALALAAPYWLPSVAEMRLVNYGTIATGHFSPKNSMVPASELLAFPVIQDDTSLNQVLPNSVGVAQLVLAGAGAVTAFWWLWRSRTPRESTAALWSGGGGSERWPGRREAVLALAWTVPLLVFCIAAMLPGAAPAWEAVPLARSIAFPWRIMGLALLWTALLGGAWLLALPRRWQTPALLGCLVLVPLAVAPYLFPRPFVSVPEPTPAEVMRYELAGGARGTASANEYLPLWVEDHNPPAILAQDYLAGRIPLRVDLASLPEGSEAVRTAGAGLSETYRLTLTGPAAVRLFRFYYPGWQAWVDGEPVEVSAARPYGFVQVSMPAGAHELRLAFGSTPIRTAAGAMAGSGLLAVAGLVLVSRGRPRAAISPTAEGEALPAGGRQAPRAESRAILAAAAVILILTGVKTSIVEPSTRWFRLASPLEQPSGMQKAVHAQFRDGVELIGYSVDTGEAVQGGELHVRLYWRALQRQPANARPVVQLHNLATDEVWSRQEKFHPASIPIHTWPDDRFVVDDYDLSIPAYVPSALTALRVSLLADDGSPVALLDGSSVVTLATARVRELRPLAASSLPGKGSAAATAFGPDLRLLDHSLQKEDGRWVMVLYWQAVAAPQGNYKVFIHVLDPEGKTVSQVDSLPLDGWYPTSEWLPGQIIADRHQVDLPAGVTGDLRVEVGLYDEKTLERLPATDMNGNPLDEDRILFGFAR